MELSDYVKLVETYTKEPPKEKTKWSRNSKLCMLFSEFRNMDIIKYNLWNIANVYGGTDTSLVIIHSGDNKHIVEETTKDWENVKYINMFEHNIPKDKCDVLVIQPSFWEENFSEYEYVLTNTWDSYLFKKIPEKFFKYDMIGGLVAHYYIESEGALYNICSNDCKCPRCNKGEHPFKHKYMKEYPNKRYLYNGGFFLRNVKSTIHTCKTKQWQGEPDDVYFSLSNMTKPPMEDALEFGVNHIKHPEPVGCHQVWTHGEEYVMSLFK
jgi:hypothetical protein